MSVNITIRKVPLHVRNELAARAGSEGKSMQEYLLGELERLAARPPIEQILARVRERKSAAPVRLRAREILDHRDVDRR
jgi:hypothetical protein